MNGLKQMAVIAGLLSASTAFAAPAPSRYRVTELPTPPAAREGCVPGYAAWGSVARVNDLGVANANFYCYSTVDPINSILEYKSTLFFVAPWHGAVVLPQDHPGGAFTYTINNRGELFGYEPAAPGGGGLLAARWTVAGGHERIFFDPACEGIQFQAAVDGNDRYVVGWGFRGDSRLPPPADQLCIRQSWLIRTADGVESVGPLDGWPLAMNAHDVAVGNSARSAIRYRVPGGETQILHAADSATSSEAVDINDLNEAVGRITRNAQPDFFNGCDPSTAVRWARDGREQVLPNLPGALSSRAWGIGNNGEVVGDSGAGAYCPFLDNASERAVLWKGGRVFDLNALIPRSSGITLTYAYGVNGAGQITAGGYDNSEPLTQCPSFEYDPVTGASSITSVPCHNQRMYLLTPVGR